MNKGRIAQIFTATELENKKLLLVTGLGFVVGVISWLLSLLMQNILVEPLFCRSTDSFGACANGGTIAITIGLIFAHTLGLFTMVRAGIYRPLLVVIAALLTLFGIHSWLGGMTWYEASAWYGLFTALTYALYTWIARLASFGSAAGVTVLVIIVLRLLMARL